ncbi:terpenoid synthase [Biscogniauxia marginata]|nr:terpenoid synthase [Biscogniauxia marginata]
MSQKIQIPDFEANWMWHRRMNPHVNEIRQKCLEWAASFGAFTPEAQKAFDKCDFALLAGLSYPWLTRDQLRAGCELMNVFFVFDEHSDKCESAEVWEQVDILMDALQNPEKPRPEKEWIGGEIARQFWDHTIRHSTKTFQRRFLKTWEEFLHGTAQQAEDRGRSYIRDFNSYIEVRRRTVGTLPSFRILEMAMNIPDDIMEHAIIQELELLATDLTIFTNDILSYNKEQACGDDEHNLVTIAMYERNLDVQGAIDWIAKLHTKMVKRFNQLYQVIPRWGGPVDLDVQSYMNGVAHFTIGNVHWSYESERYFGKRGLEIKKTREMHLLPKQVNGEIGPVMIDDRILNGHTGLAGQEKVPSE